MPLPLRKSQNQKASLSDGLFYAPWSDDPDQPDYMTDEEIDQMTDKIADFMHWK